MKFRLLLLTLACSALSLVARAGKPPGSDDGTSKKDIAGGVIHAESKKPVGQVSITAYSNNKKEKTVLTDSNGNYSFNDLKGGTYRFVFEKDGYKRVVRDKVQVRADETFQLNVELTEAEAFQFMPGQLLFSEFE